MVAALAGVDLKRETLRNMQLFLFWDAPQLAHQPADTLPVPLTQSALGALVADPDATAKLSTGPLSHAMLRTLVFGSTEDDAPCAWTEARQVADAALEMLPQSSNAENGQWKALSADNRLRLHLSMRAREVEILAARLRALQQWAGRHCQIFLPALRFSPPMQETEKIVLMALARTMPDCVSEAGLSSHLQFPQDNERTVTFASQMRHVCLLAAKGVPHAPQRLRCLARKGIRQVVVLHEPGCGHWRRDRLDKLVQELSLQLFWLQVPDTLHVRMSPLHFWRKCLRASSPASLLQIDIADDWGSRLQRWGEEMTHILCTADMTVKQVLLSEHISDAGAFCLDLAQQRHHRSVRVVAHSGWPLDTMHRWPAEMLENAAIHAYHRQALCAYERIGCKARLDSCVQWKIRWCSPRWIGRFLLRMLRVLVLGPRRVGILLTTGQARFAMDVRNSDELFNSMAMLLQEADDGRRHFCLRLREAEDNPAALRLFLEHHGASMRNFRWQRVGEAGLASFFSWSDVVVQVGAPTSASFQALSAGVPVATLPVPVQESGRPLLPHLEGKPSDKEKDDWTAATRERRVWLRLLIRQIRGYWRSCT